MNRTKLLAVGGLLLLAMSGLIFWQQQTLRREQMENSRLRARMAELEAARDENAAACSEVRMVWRELCLPSDFSASSPREANAESGISTMRVRSKTWPFKSAEPPNSGSTSTRLRRPSRVIQPPVTNVCRVASVARTVAV